MVLRLNWSVCECTGCHHDEWGYLSEKNMGHLILIEWGFFKNKQTNKYSIFSTKLCIGDGYYDDTSNTPACDYDGGDCCKEPIRTEYCDICY